MSEKWGVARGARKIELSDDELMHWKYIKRVKGKNGKWRYYYDNTNTGKGYYDNKIAKQKEIVKNATAQDTLRRGEMHRLMKNGTTIEDFNHAAAMRNHALENKQKAEKELRRLNTNYDDYKKGTDYKKDKAIEFGATKLVTFLNKSSNKIHKAKKWLSGLLNK